MAGDGPMLVAILGMALVTYLTRAGGVLLMGIVPVTPRVEAFLRYLSSSVLVALVVPAVVESHDPATFVAVVVTVLVMALSRHLVAAMVAGIVAAALLRQWGHFEAPPADMTEILPGAHPPRHGQARGAWEWATASPRSFDAPTTMEVRLCRERAHAKNDVINQASGACSSHPTGNGRSSLSSNHLLIAYPTRIASSDSDASSASRSILLEN